MEQVPNLLHEIAEIFELFSEQFILVLPNVYSRSDEHGLGLLDHLTLIFGSTVRSPQPNFLPGKNKTYGLVALMVAQLLTWPIYEYSIWTNILHQIFPSGFKGKKSSQVQQTNSTPDLSKL